MHFEIFFAQLHERIFVFGTWKLPLEISFEICYSHVHLAHGLYFSERSLFFVSSKIKHLRVVFTKRGKTPQSYGNSFHFCTLWTLQATISSPFCEFQLDLQKLLSNCPFLSYSKNKDCSENKRPRARCTWS